MQSLSKEAARQPRNEVQIIGNLAYLTLTKGQVAILDAGDVERVQRYSWIAVAVPFGKQWTARGAITGQQYISLHRYLLKATTDYFVEHRNGNGLDNRRQNLRLCPVHEEADEPSDCQRTRAVMPTLREAREQERLSLKGLALRAGVHWYTIWEAENRRAAPSLSVRQRLAQALGYQPEEMTWQPAIPNKG